MGRIMESFRRTLQLAHVMKAWRTSPDGADHDGLPPPAEDRFDDTDRVLQYLAKVTIEPAIVHGLADWVGSLRPGRLADIVLWKPAYFGVKPELVLKSGYPAWAPLGEGNATVERAEPTRYRPDWGGSGSVAAGLGVTFATEAIVRRRARASHARRPFAAVGPTRGLTRADLWSNRATAPIAVDVVDGTVTLDGRVLAVAPAEDLPLNRRYLLR
jgi:urease subunit alpha